MVRTHEINKVLVVDDEVSMCTLLENFLRQQGYGPHCTTDPVQALEMLDRDSFEVMISDIRMPGMNGMDLTRDVRT
jgi:DNA-binding NtrC family response regulator